MYTLVLSEEWNTRNVRHFNVCNNVCCHCYRFHIGNQCTLYTLVLSEEWNTWERVTFHWEIIELVTTYFIFTVKSGNFCSWVLLHGRYHVDIHLYSICLSPFKFVRSNFTCDFELGLMRIITYLWMIVGFLLLTMVSSINRANCHEMLRSVMIILVISGIALFWDNFTTSWASS